MSLALLWMIEAAFVGCAAHCIRLVARRWRAAVEFVMLFPGGNAMAAWIALQIMPMAVVAIVFGALLVQAGLAALGSLLVTTACFALFGAVCAAGALLPNVGVSRTQTPESI
jgi:hypothetical protein